MVDGLEPWHGECTCCVSFLMKPSKTHRHFFVLGCFFFPLRFTLLGVLKSLVEMKSGVFFYFYFLLFIFSLAYGFRTMKTWKKKRRVLAVTSCLVFIANAPFACKIMPKNKRLLYGQIVFVLGHFCDFSQKWRPILKALQPLNGNVLYLISYSAPRNGHHFKLVKLGARDRAFGPQWAVLDYHACVTSWFIGMIICTGYI